MIKQISSRGQCTVNRYDLRGRLFRRQDYSNAACTALEQQADFEFDTQKPGRLSAETVPGYRRAFSYDSFGRPSITTTTIDANNYTEQTTYDHLGRVFQQFDASGQGVLTEYTSRGFVKRLRDARPGRQEWLNNDPTRTITFAGSWGEIYYEVRAMDAREQVTLDWRGVVSDSETDQSLSGLAVARQYRGDTGWLSSIQAGDAVGGASTRLQHLAYQYDAVGNLRERQDLQLALRETFTYDLVNRLDTVERSSNGSLIGFEDYGYDAWGNILVKPGLSGIGYSSREIACGAGAAPGPHALSRATIEGSAKQYCYDPAGNQTATWAGAQKQREIVYSAADQVKEIKSWVASHNTRFFYGPGRNRYKRLDTDTPDGTGGVTTTHYVGSVEIIKKPNGTWEKKRYIGGVLIVTLASDGGGSKDYLFTDHLGSTDVIAHRFGNVLQRMSFDAFGARRNPTANNAPTPWGTLPIIQQLNFDTSRTTHGYTGHEGADKVGLIHMNGRMYDPVLGRFIQADSIVQDPFDPQSLNRYAYVLNNPLSATDPSGNISFKNALKLGVAIGITIATSGASASLLAEGLVGQAFATAVAGGALAGAVTGGAKGALIGAFTAAVFFGVGESFASIGNTQQAANLASTTPVYNVNAAGLTAGQTAAKIAAHASVGGTMAVLQGGKFGHGFLTAGLNEGLSGRIGRIGNPGGRIAGSALLGGTTSQLVGGKFANGAITAAFAMAFNEGVHATSNSNEDLNFTLEEYLDAVDAGLWRRAPVIEGFADDKSVASATARASVVQPSGQTDVLADPRFTDFLKSASRPTARARIKIVGEKFLVLAVNTENIVVVKRIAILKGQGGDVTSFIGGASVIAHVHYQGLVQRPCCADNLSVKLGIPGFVIGQDGSRIWELGQVGGNSVFRDVSRSTHGPWQDFAR
ncbi:MAG: RHS repeat domain-containing protein [Porticoccaceae bacterium]